jgi:hypothetical protein
MPTNPAGQLWSVEIEYVKRSASVDLIESCQVKEVGVIITVFALICGLGGVGFACTSCIQNTPYV